MSPKTSNLAILACGIGAFAVVAALGMFLVVGLFSGALMALFGIPPGVLAIVLGRTASRAIATSSERLGGADWARWGIAAGILAVLLGGLGAVMSWRVPYVVYSPL
jgi:hypothetical protein